MRPRRLRPSGISPGFPSRSVPPWGVSSPQIVIPAKAGIHLFTSTVLRSDIAGRAGRDGPYTRSPWAPAFAAMTAQGRIRDRPENQSGAPLGRRWLVCRSADDFFRAQRLDVAAAHLEPAGEHLV